MNAYELADEFRSNAPASDIFDWCHKSANMLRQQADRIAELEKELSWWRTNFKLPTEPNSHRPNWLYAPQTKRLTDEEIQEVWYDKMKNGNIGNNLIKFARAIEERIFLTRQEHKLFQNSAKMLRQQQAEIEALKSLFRQLKIEPNLPDAWRKLGEMLNE